MVKGVKEERLFLLPEKEPVLLVDQGQVEGFNYVRVVLKMVITMAGRRYLFQETRAELVMAEPSISTAGRAALEATVMPEL